MGNAEEPKNKRPPEEKTAGGQKDRGEKPGKYHYNPVNMSGKEAGVIDEVLEDVAEHEAENAEDQREQDKPKGKATDR